MKKTSIFGTDFARLVSALALASFAESMGSTYLALLATVDASMSPLQLSALLGTTATSAIISVAYFGAIADKSGRDWLLCGTLALGAIGYISSAQFTTSTMLIIVGALFIGPSSAAFPLIYGATKRWTSTQGVLSDVQTFSALRVATSIAWISGPLVAGLINMVFERYVVFIVAAISMLAGAILVFRVHSATDYVASNSEYASRRFDPTTVLPLCAICLYNVCLFMGSTALSIYVGHRYISGDAYVGYIASLSALLEVIALYFTSRFSSSPSARLLSIAVSLMALYYLILFFFDGITIVMLSQVLKAIAVALMSVLGMVFVQDLFPDRAATAAAAFENCSNVGWLLASVLGGIWANHYGYHSILALCSALCFLAAMALWITNRSHRATNR